MGRRGRDISPQQNQGRSVLLYAGPVTLSQRLMLTQDKLGLLPLASDNDWGTWSGLEVLFPIDRLERKRERGMIFMALLRRVISKKVADFIWVKVSCVLAQTQRGN